MFTKKDLAEFRFEAAGSFNLEERDMPNGGNFTIGRKDGPYVLSISDSVLSMGHEFTNMVAAVVGMPNGPRNRKSVRQFQVSRDGREGLFFCQNHLIRWYIDFHEDEKPSLYVMKDPKASWWDRVRYHLRTSRRQNKTPKQRQRYATV